MVDVGAALVGGGVGVAAGPAVVRVQRSWVARTGVTRPAGRKVTLTRLAAAMCAAVAAGAGWSPALPAWLFLALAGLTLAAIDVQTRRLPTALIGWALMGSVALLVAAAAVAGEPDRLLAAAAGAGGLFVMFWLMWAAGALSGRPGLGYGDVRLAAWLGVNLAYAGWTSLVLGVLSAFVVTAAAGVVLLAMGRAGAHTRVPFGPGLVGGALLAIVATAGGA